jgi:hypothetical protein
MYLGVDYFREINPYKWVGGMVGSTISFGYLIRHLFIKP